jgi:hypothetical protein
MEEATGRIANVKTISILSVNIVYSGDNFILYIWIMLFHIYCCISQITIVRYLFFFYAYTFRRRICPG